MTAAKRPAWKTIGVALVLAASLAATSAAATVDEKKARPWSERRGPIEITSDRLDAFQERNMVVFTGNAVAAQGKDTIKADSITLFYRKTAPGGPAGERKLSGTGELERIEAKGGVTVAGEGRTVTGNEAVYYDDAQKIVVSGNAVMREGDNVVRGERVIVLLAEDRGIVESAAGGRVTAIFYPKEAKGKNP